MVASLHDISPTQINLPLKNVRRSSMWVRFLRVLMMAGCFGVFSASAYAAQVATTTTITSNPTTGTAGVPSTFTVTVKGTDGSAVPSGQVAICTNYDEDCNLAEATFVVQLSAAGTASFKWIGVGSYTLVQAAFAGTKSYAASVSPASTQFPFLVPPSIPTVTTLAATGAPGAYTLNATMTTHAQGDGANEAPSAAMQFIDTTDGNSVLGTAVSFGGFAHSLIAPGTSPTVGTQPNYVATGDFNGDGLTDIAVVNSGDNTISILISNGDGTFKQQVTYATGGLPGNVPDAILVGDFNADGNVDLAVLNKTDKTVGILLGNGTGTFVLQTTTYPTGANPIALASGDLNEDGVADLVVLNHDDKTVSVLLGNGDGSFKTQVTYATGNDPRAIAVGDSNVDKHIDIVVANFADNNLSILLGNGDGTVTASTPLVTGNGPDAVALVDIDDAGWPSLMYLNYTDNTMTILARQFYQIPYTSTTTYTTGVGPVAFAFQSFAISPESFNPLVLNSDGTLDLYGGSGNDDGLYGPTPLTYATPAGSVSLAVGDFNGDANMDIFTGGGTSAAPELLLQQITYTFGYTITGISITGISTSNVIASFPGDATYQASSSTAVPLTDSQVTTVTSLSINPNHGVNPGGTTTLTATVGPLTGGNYTATGSITFFDGTTPICSGVAIGTGVETCTTGPLSTAQHIFTAAYSGDAYFTASTSQKRLLTVSIQSATTLSLSATAVPVGTPVMATVAVTDVNGPANGGVVNLCESTAAYCTGSALLGTLQLQNTNGSAPGTASGTLLLPAGKHNVKAVLQNTAVDAASFSPAKPLTVYPTNNTSTTLVSSGSTGKYTLTATVTSSPANPTAAGPTVTMTDAMDAAFVQTAALGGSGFTASFASPVSYVSDSANSIIHNTKLVSLRNNGVMDMVYANYNDGTLGIRLGNAGTSGSGDGTFGALTAYTLDPTADLSCPTSIASADLNGDGKADVVVADQCTGKIYLFLGNGDGTLPTAPNFIYDIDSTLTSPTQSIGPFSMTTGDFNQDGHPDIAVGTQEGTVYILLNKATGDGSFSPAVLYPGYEFDNYFTDITAVDLNGDGALDLVYTQIFGGAVSVMLGNGDGTFGYEIQNNNTGGGGDAGGGLAVGDFNNDGIPDVAVTDGASVCIMLGIGDGTFHDGTAYTAPGSFSPYAVAIADFNGDGVQDVVATNGDTTSGIGIITGQSTTQNNPDGSITYLPTGTFNSFAKLGSNFGIFDLELVAGDVNGDGVMDLVVVGQDTNKNYVLLGNGGFTATAKVTNVSVPGAVATSAHSLIASYPGDGNHNASVSPGLAIAGTLIPTTVTLGINPSSGTAYSGSNTAITATVSTTVVSSYKTTANVGFKDGTKTLGNAAVSGTSALTSGTSTNAVYNYAPAVGSHSFTGTFAGDTNFKVSSASAALADTVVQGTPVITWTPPAQIFTGNTLSGVLTATASTAGTLSYTATVSGGSAVAVTATTVLAFGNYTVTATFVPTDAVDYASPVVVSQPLSVTENVWIVNGDGGLSELHGGTPASGSEVIAGSGSAASGGVAFDSMGNVWSVNSAANQLLKATSTGSGTTLLTGGGLNAPAALAIDGNGTVWVANGSGSVSAFANGGGALSPATTGYSGGGMSAPSGISVDTAGNVWISNSGNNSATEVIGGAAPVAPLSVGLAATTLGVEP